MVHPHNKRQSLADPFAMGFDLSARCLPIAISVERDKLETVGPAYLLCVGRSIGVIAISVDFTLLIF